MFFFKAQVAVKVLCYECALMIMTFSEHNERQMDEHGIRGRRAQTVCRTRT